LINGSKVNPPTVAPGTAFSAYDWFNRVNQSTTSSSSPNFIRVFSTTYQSYRSSNASLYGGVSSNPALEQNNEALQIQSAIWINVSSAGDGVFGSGAPELQNIVGGLVQNVAGNITANLIPVTSELNPLGFSLNVLTGLANQVLNNSGQFGAPQWSGLSSGGGRSWTAFGAMLWNAVSGVATDAGALVSAVWNAATAAGAFIEAAVSSLGAQLGIDHLVSQTGGALKAFGQAMWTALRSLLNVVRGLIQELLSIPIAEFGALLASYCETLDDAVDPSGSPAVWNAIGGPLFMAGFVVALAFEVALFAIALWAAPVSLATGILLGALIGVGLTALMSILPIESALGSSMITDCKDLAGNYANQESQTQNWESWTSAFSYWESGVSNEWAAVALSGAWGMPTTGDALAFVFALTGLVLGWYGESMGGGMIASDGSLVFAVVSVAIEAREVAGGRAAIEPAPIKMLNVAILATDGGAAALDVSAWLSGN
jgi:hypothetical protein